MKHRSKPLFFLSFTISLVIPFTSGILGDEAPTLSIKNVKLNTINILMLECALNNKTEQAFLLLASGKISKTTTTSSEDELPGGRKVTRSQTQTSTFTTFANWEVTITQVQDGKQIEQKHIVPFRHPGGLAIEPNSEQEITIDTGVTITPNQLQTMLSIRIEYRIKAPEQALQKEGNYEILSSCPSQDYLPGNAPK